MESYSMELAKVSRKEIQVWRSCNLVPKRTKKHILENLPISGLVHTKYGFTYLTT
jgi:hypothetical protein